jgi:hypothetical protein
MCHIFYILSPIILSNTAIPPIFSHYILLVGCSCVATAYNNTYVNYQPKKFQDFLLIVSALRIIFFWFD